ncbi:prepilin-type N-terminal cleavage/methylation domain-containing protein [Thermodesulfobium acidiphilum]|uniref:Prepilin-type N-terminal cleavage/methylation domain-containing protein n=1 Tax=Thermodesulfobium acidiphilum TaxID=1794699 RepID=A0A2R4W1R4_THEAF|nr:prepilin-type N-terminal cleavage/methylation domain-containing protein [Thermodesulfobium acidiphilum]AWB10719.1 prepilin-type N-terminal cleavage/methylation domain-containing protein [Thermodesulfobium acidiphilum]
MNNKRGFTLTELLVVIVIASMIAIAVIYVLSSGGKSFVKNQEIDNISISVPNILYSMSREIREAGYINLQISPGTTVNANIVCVQGSSGYISFNLDVPTSQNPDGTGAYSVVKYQLQNGNLSRCVNNTTCSVLNPPNVVFTAFSPVLGSVNSSANFVPNQVDPFGNYNVVQIVITARLKSSNNSYTFTKEVKLRNVQ